MTAMSNNNPNLSRKVETARTAAITKIEASNALADLAARIKAEHEAVSTALKDSIRHAIRAGSLLVEAKEQLKHGQWLPWLRDHCTISERTAQLYMRCAKNREAIEDQIRNGVADLSLNEAAAMLMLSSDVRKLLALTKTMAGLEGEELIKFCVDNDIATLTTPFGDVPEPTDQERVEWNLFALFLMREFGWPLDSAFMHVEWVQSRGTPLADWMRPNPILDTWRRIPQTTFDAWNIFLETNRNRTLADVEAEIGREDRARLDELNKLLRTGRLSRKDQRLVTAELARRAP
jgi:hypothetical protein